MAGISLQEEMVAWHEETEKFRQRHVDDMDTGIVLGQLEMTQAMANRLPRNAVTHDIGGFFQNRKIRVPEEFANNPAGRIEWMWRLLADNPNPGGQLIEETAGLTAEILTYGIMQHHIPLLPDSPPLNEWVQGVRNKLYAYRESIQEKIEHGSLPEVRNDPSAVVNTVLEPPPSGSAPKPKRPGGVAQLSDFRKKPKPK